jgi:glutaconate CoA-transferase subunit B
MKVKGLQAGVTLEQVQERTGFKLLFDDEIESLNPPTRDELAILREFDPERIYID